MKKTLVTLGLLSASLNPQNLADQNAIQVSELNLRKAALRKVDPDYPAVARQIRLTGDVELEVQVDPTGIVDKVKIIHGNTLLTGSSLQAIRKWRFSPFLLDGQPVRATGTIKFSFEM